MKIKTDPRISNYAEESIEVMRFYLQNFRQFKNKTMVDFRNVTLFVGPNGAGKSNLIKAYYLFLTTTRDLSKGKKFISDWKFDSIVSNPLLRNSEIYLRVEQKQYKRDYFVYAEYTYKKAGTKTQISKAAIGVINQNGIEESLIEIDFNKKHVVQEDLYSKLRNQFREKLEFLGVKLGIAIYPTNLYTIDTNIDDDLFNFLLAFNLFSHKIDSESSEIPLVPFAILYGDEKLDRLTKEKVEETVTEVISYYEDISYILSSLSLFYASLDDERDVNFFGEDVRLFPPKYFKVEKGIVLNDYYNIVKIIQKPVEEVFTPGEFEILENNELKFTPTDDEYKINELYILKRLLKEFQIADNIFLKKVGKLDDKIFYRVYFKLKENIFPLHQLSSGNIQLLPILLQIATLAASGTYADSPLILKQPELHLHPKIQMKIPEIIVKYGLEINWWIETHSEHIIRKFQILVSKSENFNKDKIVVNYVGIDSKNQNSFVKQLRMDEKGNFIDDWPGGFFDEASELAYALLEAQLKRKN